MDDAVFRHARATNDVATADDDGDLPAEFTRRRNLACDDAEFCRIDPQLPDGRKAFTADFQDETLWNFQR
jgi:hypothetical protein